jgi:hypothetical protein
LYDEEANGLTKTNWKERNMPKTVQRDFAEFKRLDRRVEEIARQYRYAKTKILMIPAIARQGEYLLNEPDDLKRYLQKHESFIAAVDCALTFLSEEEKRLLKSDYLNKDVRFWWVSFYSRSTYYRIKRRAMIEFLSYFN